MDQALDLPGCDIQEDDFVNVMCRYADVINIIKKIKNVRKKLTLLYMAIGYEDWEIAKILRVSDQSINQNIKWIKKKIKIIQNY